MYSFTEVKMSHYKKYKETIKKSIKNWKCIPKLDVYKKYDYTIYSDIFYFRFFCGDGKGFRIRKDPEIATKRIEYPLGSNQKVWAGYISFRVPFIKHVNYNDIY